MSANAPAAGRRYGRYEVIGKIASGGMGEVYLARSVGAAGFHKLVVVKRILPHLVEQPHVVKSLVREAKLLLLLDHPNIVQVLDLGQEGPDYFMAMEFVQGYDLATIIHYCSQRDLTVPPLACAAVALGVLGGLGYAHDLTTPQGQRQFIVHRDVSPQNVLISREGLVKLTDFGIAKVLRNASAELTGSIKGKLRYVAPEALDGSQIDRRYDLFAVGVLLYEALARRHLFGGQSEAEIMDNVRSLKVPPIAQFHPAVSTALEQVMLKALERRPQDRFQTADECSTALLQAIAPANEADARAALREFVQTVYELPDFPLRRAKLPNPYLSAPAIRPSSSSPRESPNPPALDDAGVPTVGRPRDLSGHTRKLPLGARLIYAMLAILALGLSLVAYRLVAYRFVKDDFRSVGGRPAPPLRDPSKVGTEPSGATPESIATVLAAHATEIRRCSDDHMPGDQTELRLTLRLQIQPTGQVGGISIDPAEVDKSALADCLRAAISALAFPPHRGPTIHWAQPVTFKRSR